MIDVNYPLRKAYMTALSGITYETVTVPVFYQYLPDTINPDLYIIIDSINNNSNGTINTQDTFTTINLSVHSSGLKYSNGQAVSNVAGQVLTAIYPTPAAVLNLSADNLQMTSTVLQSDNEQSFTSQGAKIYIDRILTFGHKIYQK